MNGSAAPSSYTSGNVLTFTSTRQAELGALLNTRDGRVFRYVKAGAVDLVVGNVLQAPAQVTTHQQMTPAVTAVGARTITVTLGATNATTANQYAGGWAIVDTTPGLGYAYPIASHPAAAAAATCVLTLQSDALVQVALTASSRVSLVPSPYNGVIQSPITTLTGAVVGVAVAPIPATQYGWAQISGPGAVLVAGTPGVGLAVVVPGTVAGAVVVDGAAAATKVVGSMLVTGVDTKVQGVFLDIQ
jgi:hypothetical protein